MNEQQRGGLSSVAGWLGTIVGGFGALISACLLVLISLHPGPVRGASRMPGYIPLLYAEPRFLPALFLALASVAVGAGFGLLRRRRYGRILALTFSVCAIAWFVFVVPPIWLGVFSPGPGAPSLLFRLGPALMVTPVALALIVAFSLFFRLLLAHPADFS